ncbi:hypothetical protein R5R35_007809 [Gryllus longicercus]|uniref:Adenosine deaminase domain-containing protein n=1 Tax=Gryllus longicercus TaxID=2509291 RepID=A0AAN9WFH5_9ORTH
MWTTAKFCAQLPKIELHAHLNGSLSRDTLKRLHIMKEGNSADDIDIPDITKMTNLEECFKIFGLAHSLTSSPEALRVATSDVVREFAEDGVVHLELRTTPRAVESIMSHEQYVEAVLEEATREGAAQGIGVKVLLSVDRSQGEAAAQRVLTLALAARRRWPEALVGIDLSGNPRSGCARALLPLLRDARARGLRVAAHCAEVENEAEAVALMEAGVADRLGHCTFAAPGAGAGAEAAWAALRATRLPVEACLSSNVRCGTVPSYASHHFGALRRHNHPVALCTDDKKNFGSSALKVWNIHLLQRKRSNKFEIHFLNGRKQTWLNLNSIKYFILEKVAREMNI